MKKLGNCEREIRKKQGRKQLDPGQWFFCRQKQRLFRDFVITPLIEQAKNGLIELFFMDAPHFVMGRLPARVWSAVRKYVKTSSGRKRFNVLGALNFVTKKSKQFLTTAILHQCRL